MIARSLYRLFAAACLMAAVPGQTEPVAHVPVDVIGQLPFLASPLLSPEGTHIAARISMDGQRHIAVWTLGPESGQPTSTINAGGLDTFSWLNNQRLLLSGNRATFIITSAGIGLALSRMVFAYDLGSTELRPLTVPDVVLLDVVHTDVAGRYILVSGQNRRASTPGVYRIDIASGESIEVQRPVSGVWSWFADADGTIRVGVDYGERRTRIYYRATATGELRRHETRRNLLDNSVIDMIRFTANIDHGVIVTNAETGRFGLYEYNFAADARGATLFEHPDVDISSTIFGVDGTVDGVVYEDDRPRVLWFNPEMADLQGRLDRALPGKTNVIINRSRDGNKTLVFSGAADDPGTFYIFDQAARELRIFASPFDQLHEHRFAVVRPIEFESRDGLRIHGYLTLPPGQEDARGLPLIVVPHGGPFLRDSWTFDPWVQFLATRGYAVLQPNFRGSTGYGRDFVELGYGQLGDGMIDDIDDATDWLVGQGIADPARVCIMGASYGGYAAIWGAMRNPQRYRCAVSWAGPTDLAAMLRHSTPFFIPRRYIRERRRQLRGDEETNLRSISPLRATAQLSVPLLIGHGERDTVVPPDQSHRFVRALRGRPDVESVFYERSGHDFGSAEDQIDYMTRVEAFLARHNPARLTEPEHETATESGVPISTSSR